jgi:hypothetical protein
MKKENPSPRAAQEEDSMSMSDESPKNVKQLADHLQVKPSWVYAKAAANLIPSLKVGKYRRFYLSEVLKRLAEADKP